ncbi:MAG TPA: amidohydrolase family protein [Gemmatimonadaceae bacterium]|nr:amidohydrolase family protein [Gemmatimonadaceae bacterium]
MSVPQPRAQYAIRTDRILDPRTGAYSSASVLLVGSGKVVDVLPGASYRPDLADSTIDLRGLTVLPGLIDAHVHLGIGGQPAANALTDLRAGFTTVVDLGARTQRILRVRDSIDAGLLPGPRVLAAGLWIGIQGGVCEFNGLGVVGGAEAFRARVRENVDAGADIIKLCLSGWPNEAFSAPQKYEVSDEVITAVVEEARRANRKVVAHDISLGGVQAALRAGVHGLAHAAYVDSATALQLRTRNIFLIPTLASLAGADTSPPSRTLIGAVALAHRVGISIVFGTDGGVLPHGRNAEEFSALARAGLAPLDAIRAATINAARAFGLADSVGTLARGMSADLIAVPADPLIDVTVLKTPRFVMGRGRVVVP